MAKPTENDDEALTWHGKSDIRCEQVDDPIIEDDRDIIIKVTACAICGSDLHLMGGFVPEMHAHDVLGHETMGEVVEVRTGHSNSRSASASWCRSRSPAASAGCASGS